MLVRRGIVLIVSMAVTSPYVGPDVLARIRNGCLVGRRSALSKPVLTDEVRPTRGLSVVSQKYFYALRFIIYFTRPHLDVLYPCSHAAKALEMHSCGSEKSTRRKREDEPR